MDHPLHLSIGNEVKRQINGSVSLVRDEACGGSQHIPLFCGTERSRVTQLCKVDLLVIKSDRVSVIMEIEESGFNPTKICGKFLTSAIATHFIHDSERNHVIPYDEKVLFVQVLDGSKFLKPGTSKRKQGELIATEIGRQLPLKASHIAEYRLFIVDGVQDTAGIKKIGQTVADFV